jgi:hypothetical protein
MQMKRILFISLVLALMLSLVLPSVAMAAPKPAVFSAQGIMTGIDTGDVKPLGDTGRFLVKDRHIQGEFTGGDLGTASFVITYGGIFDLQTQAGFLTGKMEVDSKKIIISGATKPLTLVDMGGYYLPKLEICGLWSGAKGINAAGTFTAYMIFVPTPDGHVAYIVNSSFDMTGRTK